MDKQTVLNFIRHFKNAQITFLNGCCYWFCYILNARFGGETYYEPIEGHFIQMINGDFFDVRGEVTHLYQDKKSLIRWDGYENIDPTHYRHIVRDCVKKERFEDDEIHRT